MKFINPIFKTQKIKTFLFDLMHGFNCDTYEKLTYDNRCEFVTLILEVLSKNHEAEHYQDLHEAMHKNNNLMKALFNEMRSDYESEWNEWMQYACKHGDPDQIYDSYRDKPW